jgi:phospho-N-acetylmuramoyl-pentapeptide-transferase
MLFYLTRLKTVFGPLNVFQYQTFRAGGAALTALALSLGLGPWLIRLLKRLHVGQVMREEGPRSHLSKKGTPTMGGLLIVMSLLAGALLWMRLDERFTWILILAVGALAALGLWDDYVKLTRQNAAGASSRTKFAIQAILAFAVVGYLAAYPPAPGAETSLSIPYAKEISWDAGRLYFAIAALLILASSNAVNLTDGLDGLAAGSVIFCAIAYGVVAYAAGNAKFAAYLKILHVEGAGEISVFLAAMVGACLGFLWFNAYPAEVFMGDTGSLALGGAIGCAALLVKQELLLPIVGGVFVIETLSVIIQIASYKLRKGKRVFKMAPLHHHFELSGVPEPKVTVRFWIASIVLMLLALASLKLR